MSDMIDLSCEVMKATSSQSFVASDENRLHVKAAQTSCELILWTVADRARGL